MGTRFGYPLELDGRDCAPQPMFNHVEIPNCDDPVFRAYCQACGIVPGSMVPADDLRIQRLQNAMEDPTFDPWQDTADDYLTRGL